jgi:hypothetical protein
MPDVIDDPSVDQITEQHPVPPRLGECPRCRYSIFELGLDFADTYRNYYTNNNVRASQLPDQMWAPYTLRDGRLFHYACTA